MSSIDAAKVSPHRNYTILGREVHLPFEVRDATAAVAFYLVSAAAAQALVNPSGLSVARVMPGRTICTIGALDYKDGELGAYQEMSITFFVHEPGSRFVPFLGTVVGMLRSNLSAYVYSLPVDGELTCETGRLIWGLPKFIADIDISSEGDTQTAVLRADGQHVFTQAMRMGGNRTIESRGQVSYAVRDGLLHRSTSDMRGEQVAARLGGATLELGTHPLADELRSLGLPKRPLFSTYMNKMTGVFYEAETSSLAASA